MSGGPDLTPLDEASLAATEAIIDHLTNNLKAQILNIGKGETNHLKHNLSIAALIVAVREVVQEHPERLMDPEQMLELVMTLAETLRVVAERQSAVNTH